MERQMVQLIIKGIFMRIVRKFILIGALLFMGISSYCVDVSSNWGPYAVVEIEIKPWSEILPGFVTDTTIANSHSKSIAYYLDDLERLKRIIQYLNWCVGYKSITNVINYEKDIENLNSTYKKETDSLYQYMKDSGYKLTSEGYNKQKARMMSNISNSIENYDFKRCWEFILEDFDKIQDAPMGYVMYIGNINRDASFVVFNGQDHLFSEKMNTVMEALSLKETEDRDMTYPLVVRWSPVIYYDRSLDKVGYKMVGIIASEFRQSGNVRLFTKLLTVQSIQSKDPVFAFTDLPFLPMPSETIKNKNKQHHAGFKLEWTDETRKDLYMNTMQGDSYVVAVSAKNGTRWQIKLGESEKLKLRGVNKGNTTETMIFNTIPMFDPFVPNFYRDQIKNIEIN